MAESANDPCPAEEKYSTEHKAAPEKPWQTAKARKSASLSKLGKTSKFCESSKNRARKRTSKDVADPEALKAENLHVVKVREAELKSDYYRLQCIQNQVYAMWSTWVEHLRSREKKRLCQGWSYNFEVLAYLMEINKLSKCAVSVV